MVSQGQFPFGNFMFEYPPLAIPFFAVPLVIASTFDSYKLAFAYEMKAINAFAVWLVAREAQRTEGVARVPPRLAWYTAYFVILCPLTVTRFDLVPMLLAFLAAILFARDRPLAGGITAGIGALTKLVPGLTILPLPASADPLKSKVRATAALLIIVSIGILGSYILGGDRIVASLRYHADRGLEIESSYTSIYIILQRVAGLPISGRYDHQSINVYGPGSKLVAGFSPVLQCVCLLLVAWWARRTIRAKSIRLAATLLLAYIVTSKVLSPQYLIWLISFVALSRSAQRVFLVCCMLTTVIFPWSFKGLVGLESWPECLQVARNIGLMWLFAIMLVNPRRTRATGELNSVEIVTPQEWIANASYASSRRWELWNPGNWHRAADFQEYSRTTIEYLAVRVRQYTMNLAQMHPLVRPRQAKAALAADSVSHVRRHEARIATRRRALHDDTRFKTIATIKFSKL
jgi:hypothetical protein